jgi:hypothetical protein
MWKPLNFEEWCEELGWHLAVQASEADLTEWTVFCLRKYQEYLSTFD